MSTFETFEECLRDALAHLYDPAYRPPEILWIVTGCDPQQGLEAIQAALVQAIEDLKPAPHVPPTARSRRIYGLLFHGYVQDLTQEQTAERLGITPRHVRREQSSAIHALALRLWEQRPADLPLPSELVRDEEMRLPEGTMQGVESPQYRSQVRQELISLHEMAPGATTDVEEAIHSVVKLGSALISNRDFTLEAEPVQPNLVAAIHPSVLRQVLIAAVRQLAQLMSSGRVSLRAERRARNIEITITGRPAVAPSLFESNFIQEILAVQGGSTEVSVEEDRTHLVVRLPSVDRVVLVVDDNPDLIHLYRRYAVGTRYHIKHVSEGERVFEAVQAFSPDIIVLDVMLPDADGWEVLAHLHEHSATRFLPVIVCSVVREEQLALALGASLYLSKPIQREQFIQALDQVVNQAEAEASTAQANNAAPC
jgi:CheY-like chemotaxis protein